MSHNATKNDFPIYDSKIYEFEEDDEESIKEFILSNPNLESLIKIYIKDG